MKRGTMNADRVSRPGFKAAAAKLAGKIFAVVALAAFSTARADVYCNGVVPEHLVYNDGTLMIIAPWNGQWIFLCNMQSPWKGVSTEACYSWYSLITSAKIHNKSVGFYYSGETACSNFGGYGGAPGPLYVRME
jgi:hypothetical protein